jgi:hypothetical protein
MPRFHPQGEGSRAKLIRTDRLCSAADSNVHPSQTRENPACYKLAGDRREIPPCARRAKISRMLPRSSARSSLPALLFLSLLLSLAMPATSQQNEAKPAQPSHADAPVLVELFTSEGCSSCPPADILIQRLDTYQPIPGAHLIVLSEHVTYWDHDGWKDPNSAQLFTDRQSSYETALGQKESFTPQIIVDGTQQVSLTDTQHMEEVLNKAKDVPKIPVRIGEVTVDPANPGVLRAHVETDANDDKHNADVYVALALDHVESQVLRGENKDHHLVHVAVVQQLTKVGKLSKGKTFAQDVQLKLKAGEDPKNLRLIAFVQEPGPGKILGAAVTKPAN